MSLGREAVHQLTRQLVSTYGGAMIGDLDLTSMTWPIRRRACRRAITSAGLGAIRPTLAYNAERSGVRLVVGDRCFPSS